MKYLKYFETEAEYNAYLQSEDFILPNVSYAVDTDSVFYHVVKTETGDYKMYIFESKDISGLTYNAVDLNLPSGILWADRNVGASAPEDFGAYFSWGETVGYTCSIKYCTEQEACNYLQSVVGDAMEVTPDVLKQILLSAGIEDGDFTKAGMGFIPGNVFADWSDYFDTTDGGVTFNKYETDKLTVLQPEDDAATVNMGSEYRMPTESDFNELINNCTATFIDRDGNEIINMDDTFYNLKGVKFTGSNGNSIFIPACGYLAEMFHSSLGGIMATQSYYEGAYWTSECEHATAINTVILSECSIHVGSYHGASYVGTNNRYCGQSVRGVKA